MRVAHADNLNFPLPIVPVAVIAAAVAEVAAQVAAVALELTFVLASFAPVVTLEIAPNLAPVCSYFPPVSADFACIAPHLCFARCRSDHDECCACKNLRDHWFSVMVVFAWLSVTPSA
jgi:hypothetical protein